MSSTSDPRTSRRQHSGGLHRHTRANAGRGRNPAAASPSRTIRPVTHRVDRQSVIGQQYASSSSEIAVSTRSSRSSMCSSRRRRLPTKALRSPTTSELGAAGDHSECVPDRVAADEESDPPDLLAQMVARSRERPRPPSRSIRCPTLRPRDGSRIEPAGGRSATRRRRSRGRTRHETYLPAEQERHRPAPDRSARFGSRWSRTRPCLRRQTVPRAVARDRCRGS